MKKWLYTLLITLVVGFVVFRINYHIKQHFKENLIYYIHHLPHAENSYNSDVDGISIMIILKS